jgi:putative intracellular protease/amidase
MMVTALSPIIGYDQAAAISYYAIDHDLTLKEAALARAYPRTCTTRSSSPSTSPTPAAPTSRQMVRGPDMKPSDAQVDRAARAMDPVGKAALIASVGGARGYADWTNPDHRLRRLLSEFIGMAGLTFVLSGGAAILARYGGHGLQPWQTVLILSLVSALWLVVAVYFLGDISAHFNPATTLAFALRRDMGWVMAGIYWVVQFGAAICGSLLARGSSARPST